MSGTEILNVYGFYTSEVCSHIFKLLQELVDFPEFPAKDSMSITFFRAFKTPILLPFVRVLLYSLGSDMENYLVADTELCATLLKKLIDPHTLALFAENTEVLTDGLHAKVANMLAQLNVSIRCYTTC